MNEIECLNLAELNLCKFDHANRAYSPLGIAPTLTANTGCLSSSVGKVVEVKKYAPKD